MSGDQPQPSQRPAIGTADYVLLGLAAAVFLYLRIGLPLSQSLWVDELGTFWVIDGSFGQTIDRAIEYHGQSPLYYLIVKATTSIFGSGELALRLPSVVAFSVSLIVFYKLTNRLASRGAAVVSTVGLMTVPSFSFIGADARPYAFAILFLVLSSDLLERWLSNGGLGRGLAYAVAAALMWWTHYVFIIALAGQAVFWLWHRRSGDHRPSNGESVLVFAALGALVAPTLPQLLDLSGRTGELVFSATPSIPGGVSALTLPLLAGALVAAVVIHLTGGETRSDVDRRAMALGLSGAVIPIAILVLLAQLTDIVLWADRYRVMMVPFAALTLGVAIAAMAPHAVKYIALALLIVSSAAPVANRSPEDWRGAITAANEHLVDDAVLLLGQGLIENAQQDFVDDEANTSYLTSAIAYYPSPVEGIPLPIVPQAADARLVLEDVQRRATQASTIVVISRTLTGDSGPTALRVLLEEAGYEAFDVGRFGTVRVVGFTR